MEVVYPQLWIFNFNSSDWTCVEAAGGKGGAGAGGKAKGSNSASGAAGGSVGGNVAAGPGPPAVFDHTATLAGGKHIVVIGGIMVGRALNSQARKGQKSRPPARRSVVLCSVVNYRRPNAQ